MLEVISAGMIMRSANFAVNHLTGTAAVFHFPAWMDDASILIIRGTPF
jgi:hypothetical protein